MSLKTHPVFAALELADSHEKKGGVWGLGTHDTSKRAFMAALGKAHPFLFDRVVTYEKRSQGRGKFNLETLVEDFSLPFGTSLYLLSDAPTLMSPTATGEGMIATDMLGYLISEVSPEKFMAWSIARCTWEGHVLPAIQQFEIDLDRMRSCGWHDVEDASVEMHFLKEISCIMQFTQAISVKRIGVEKIRSFSVRSRGIGQLGYTSVKSDRLIHIADKEEYEFTEPVESDINWDWRGFWRGHWRAFYVKDAAGNKIKDERGWYVVDYGRLGKNREGKKECVPGYAWVVEHTKGNPELAEIKTRVVKHR
jgi:hypothetical protein